MNKYVLSVESGRFNPIHEEVKGKEAVMLECEVGQRGWIAYRSDDPGMPWHRLHTSIVMGVEEDDNGITVRTMNSVYRLEVI